MKCPVCDSKERDNIEGNFTIDVSDGYHGKQISDVSVFLCKKCGNIYGV